MVVRPSYTAYRVAVAEFGQPGSVRRLSLNEVDAVDSAVEGYAFQVGNEERWLLWSEGGKTQTRLPARTIEVRDKFGNSLPLQGDDASPVVGLDGDPIYVHLRPLTARLWPPIITVAGD